ncbi:hypothetical protein [Candidatus Nitrospira inopinata]|jgi:hypothetical protein|uniref:Uncharacterized protein n=1 Tax=Candidatus Nitrospira inopinata TaxID=1715989 RepID=A0A0S4KSB9_9BACT|nr:hypothetical protein [Candidatus Nitrospira inopinata]CUQ67239.1 conserved protein of unknown function [Candidatus Nitrospira inopinata]
MRVKLDQEEWESLEQATLGEVLAEVSDRAHARSRLVTALRLDHREITDRDIDASLMMEPASRYGRLIAVTQSVEDIEHDAWIAAGRYAKLLHAEGLSLLEAWRAGTSRDLAMNEWLGQLADYLEFTEGRDRQCPADRRTSLSFWVEELLTARDGGDLILTADLLEYEILPRLAA